MQHVSFPSGAISRVGKLLYSSAVLREAGKLLPLSGDDQASLTRQLVCDTAEAAWILGCSRQNINDLLWRGKLVPLKTGMRGTLFLRSDVLARG